MNPLTALLSSRLVRGALAPLGVAVVLVPLLAAALEGRDAVAAQTTPAAGAQPGDHRPGFGWLADRCWRRAAVGSALRHRLDTALDNLVAEGVLTEEEAAAVRDEIIGGGNDDERAATGATTGATPAADGSSQRERPERAGPCTRLARFGAWLADVATIVGLTPDEVLARLAAGESLAEIAESEGVSRDDLIAGLEAAIAARLDVAVANGRLSEAERAEIEANLTEWLTALVDRRHGHRHPAAPATATPDAAAST